MVGVDAGSFGPQFDALMPWVERSSLLVQAEEGSASYQMVINGTDNMIGNASDFDLRVWLPRKRISSGACIVDRHCRGPDPANPVGGECVGRTCMCPLPWVGPGCKKLLACSFWESTSGWGDNTCALDINLTNADRFVCACLGVGSLDLVVVQRAVQVKKKAPFLAIRAVNWSDILHYFSWETFLAYPHVFGLVLGIGTE